MAGRYDREHRSRSRHRHRHPIPRRSSAAPVEVVRHDITTDAVEQDAFDLVHARAVLEHLPSRGELVTRLAKALRSGGVLVLEDTAFGPALLPVSGRVVSPPSKAAVLSRVITAMAAGFHAVGADPEFGLELPAVLAAAGVRDIDAELTARLIQGGSEESAFYAMSLREAGSRLIAAGLLTQQDLPEALALAQDPASHWFSLVMVTAWGWRG